MSLLLTVEDDAAIRALVRLRFRVDPAFELDGEAVDAAGAIEAASSFAPDIIVLDHFLEGDITGLDVAPQLKEIAPEAKLILFSASEQLRIPALQSPAVDAFVLKTDISLLVAVARELLGLPSASP